MEGFKQRLRMLRKRLDKRQDEIAKHIGVARTTYAMYEQGRREPGLLTLVHLADVFQILVDDLLGDKPCQSKELEPAKQEASIEVSTRGR